MRAASKGLTSVDEAPASTTVLTQEELRAFGWRTLAEALAGVRGFFLADDRTYTYVGVRGFSPPGDLNTRILILWDGHSMNDVWAGQGYAAHDLSVDLEEVERIEVVRGPGSAAVRHRRLLRRHQRGAARVAGAGTARGGDGRGGGAGHRAAARLRGVGERRGTLRAAVRARA